jgi:hypothetical protein
MKREPVTEPPEKHCEHEWHWLWAEREMGRRQWALIDSNQNKPKKGRFRKRNGS